jgi:nicotinamidase-related amidase
MSPRHPRPLHEALDEQPQDTIVQRYLFSAFLQEASELARLLRAQGCDTVSIIGTGTNACGLDDRLL